MTLIVALILLQILTEQAHLLLAQDADCLCQLSESAVSTGGHEQVALDIKTCSVCVCVWLYKYAIHAHPTLCQIGMNSELVAFFN